MGLICVPMLLPMSVIVVAAVFVWAMFTIAVFEITQPFKDQKIGRLMLFSQLNLLLTMLIGLLLKYDVLAMDGVDAHEALLAFVLIGVMWV